MYAEANGYYWLAGAVGGLGEEYHGGNGSDGKSQAECLRILADHLRISLDDAKHIAEACEIAYGSDAAAAKRVFRTYVISQRGRWQKEAQDGLALLRSLAE